MLFYFSEDGLVVVNLEAIETCDLDSEADSNELQVRVNLASGNTIHFNGSEALSFIKFLNNNNVARGK